MISVLQQVYSSYLDYIEDMRYWSLFLICLIVLFLVGRKSQQKKYIYVSLAVWLAIYVCPITAKFIMDYGIGREVYWRMFWLVPVPIIIAWGITELVLRVGDRKKQLLVIVCSLVLFAVVGTSVYSNGNYMHYNNYYKIPDAAVNVCNTINIDAKDNGISQKKVVVPNDLLCYIRQYDATILMPYGRNALRNEAMHSGAETIFAEMNYLDKNWDELLLAMRESQCNYLVYPYDVDAEQEITARGCTLIGYTDTYAVYRIN